MKFKNKNVIVTGGTRGIGRGIAENFLQQGAQVLVTYSGNTEAAEKFKADNAQFSEQIYTAKFNVADNSDCEGFFNELPFDQIHILVNNAGIRKDNIVAMMPADDWNDVIDINLTGTYNMCKFAVMKMSRQRFGRIINITSPCSHFGFAGQANYAASKAGQIGLTRSLSKEVAKRKITVNCVSPGFIGTELIADLPENLVAEYKSQIPMKRFGSVEEVASCVNFLASDEASYVNGTVLEVTGGL